MKTIVCQDKSCQCLKVPDTNSLAVKKCQGRIVDTIDDRIFTKTNSSKSFLLDHYKTRSKSNKLEKIILKKKASKLS